MQPTNSTPTIVSFTLAGPGTADIIGDALRSVAPIVDDAIVICTGDRDLDISGAALAAIGDERLTLQSWKWRDDFGAARNAALDLAHIGSPWGLMLDTDERVICPDPAALRAFLGALPDHVIVALAYSDDGEYTRERFFRLPARSKFVGSTHEQFHATAHQQALIPREIVMWSELKKTRFQLRAKTERDLRMLEADTSADPTNGAPLYYLGYTLQTLSIFAREDDADLSRSRTLLTQAIECYRAHMRLDGGATKVDENARGIVSPRSGSAWHEGTAFSAYRAAECYIALEQPDRAIDAALAGLALDAGIGELYWIASVASLQAGRHEQARAWATSAKAHGMGSESERRRRGFRVPRGLTTGPDEVIAAARAHVTRS